MQTGVLITNNGPHSPEDWAMATSEMIFPLGEVSDQGRRIDALRLQANIADALKEPHGTVQANERNALAADPARHESADYEVAEHVDASLGAVLGVAAGTAWAPHFANPDVQTVIKGILHSHFATAQHIERSWHADRLAQKGA